MKNILATVVLLALMALSAEAHDRSHGSGQLSAFDGAQDEASTKAMTVAMAHVYERNWSDASIAAEPAGQIGADIVQWHRLRASAGTFDEYIDFLRDHPDWPGLELLKNQGEFRIPTDASPGKVISYFDAGLPQTGTGALRLAAAHAVSGDRGTANAIIVTAWRTLSMNRAEHQAFVELHEDLLLDHHRVRQDMLLWRGLTTQAKRLNPLVGRDHAKLADARRALIMGKKRTSALIKAVPDALKSDPGLAHARFQWRLKKRPAAEAIELLRAHSTSVATLGEPEEWADGRRALARRMMREGKAELAYQLASQHRLSAGHNFSDLEWLSGFIALTDLDDAELALHHFQNFRRAVFTPISLGRAGYWEGRALDALDQPHAAQAAYSFGGEYQTSFYGQLAAQMAGLKMDPGLRGIEEYPEILSGPLAENPVLRAALLFRKSGHLGLYTRFLRHLAETLEPSQQGALAQLALNFEDHTTALKLAKYAAEQGNVLARPYFPIIELGDVAYNVPPELILAVIRRESEFAPGVSSGAGARGQMQLISSTARAMARMLGLKYSRSRLLSDAAYNRQLGSAYLGQLIGEFDGYLPFVAAAYNAGPRRVATWNKAQGDPRGSAEAAVDWIEHIPFRETRNYVMRVMESLAVYRARLSGEVSALGLAGALADRLSVTPAH